jgi:hypothetical protein
MPFTIGANAIPVQLYASASQSTLMVDPVVLNADQTPDVVGIQNTAANLLPILMIHIHDILIRNSGLHPSGFTHYQGSLRRCVVSDSLGHLELPG